MNKENIRRRLCRYFSQ